MKKLALFLILACTGCSALDAVFTPSPNVVATMEATLAAADQAALQYVLLPSCASASHPKICRDPAITKNIDKARTAAYTAVKTAEQNETASTVQAANNLVSAYQNITNALQ